MLFGTKRYLHIKKVPKLYINKFNEANIKNIPTHEVFNKFGFLNNFKPGLVNWMPSGLLIVNKLKQVISRRMNEVGAEEVSLSLLSHNSLWQKTGRWGNTELFKLQDSHDTDYCLSPTSEEEVTNLVKNNVNSYKDYPILYYQIHEKFRDEKRPRMGLLRSREFMMKDAYSFDINDEEAKKSYDHVVEAYHKIFQDLKVPFVKAIADTGDIGGSLSHEWHYIDKSGEDTLFTCTNCNATSNIEKTLSTTDTKHEGDISVKYFSNHDDGTVLRVHYPSNRQFEEGFLTTVYGNITPTHETNDAVDVFDTRIDNKGIPIVTSEENEICYSCQSGRLVEHRAIEVGHTFYLGQKYSEPLDLTVSVPDETGKLQPPQPVIMGCYGIGISRIIAAVAEVTRDDIGFKWPAVMAPWHVTVIKTPSFKSDDFIFTNLASIDYRLDDRKGNLGGKITDSNRMGIPLVVILGKQFPTVEIEVRGIVYGDSWRQVYSNRDFTWDIHHHQNHQKHYTTAEALPKVIDALLKDM